MYTKKLHGNLEIYLWVCFNLAIVAILRSSGDENSHCRRKWRTQAIHGISSKKSVTVLKVVAAVVVTFNPKIQH